MKKTKKSEKISPLASKQKEKYISAFVIAFIAFAVVLLPLTIYTGGYFIYYGDFNSQQMPFYYHAHEMVKNGDFFWDWGTDLGSNFIGSYSFYLFFSPFFWLTFFLKQEYLMYAMSVLLCLKYAVASLTAYIYIRKFVKNTDCALIGALLYAFSGFQSYNVFFNHFHDVTAFFPLLLCAFEDRINKNRRGVFVLAVAFMASLNYFFFTGQVAFGIIYLIMRCSSDDFKIDAKKYGSIIIEAVLGGMIACVALLPSALAISDNSRVSSGLFGMDLVAYDDNTRLWRIIQSFFMIPDAPARPNLFDSEHAKWASIAGYLPLFSMAGVITFMKNKRSHWASKTIFICIICAFIPVLNSMFYLFNGSYYARWYYMPILIMAMMTAQTLEDSEADMKQGLKVCTSFLIVFGVISVLPTIKDDETKWFSFASNPAYFYITLGVTLVCLLYAYRISKLKNEGRPYQKHAVIATATACALCTAVTVYFGVSIGPYPDEYINATFKAEKFELDDTSENSENSFWRADMSEDHDNYPMFWGYSSMRTFHSIVPASIMDFYSEIGITRDVASRAPTDSYTLRGLFSVRYFFNWNDGSDGSTESPVKGFTYLKSQNGFDVYENQYFIPMGFTYDYYISESDAKAISFDADREKLLIKAVVLDDKYDASSVSLTKISDVNVSEDDYYAECEKRAESSCYSFEYDSKGFTAKTNLENETLVFFSVPYDKGWTATVNGVEAEIVKANYGFMAVKGEIGENIIKFTYVPDGLEIDAVISAVGIVLFIVYMAVSANMDKKAAAKARKKKKAAKAKKKQIAESTENSVEQPDNTAENNIEQPDNNNEKKSDGNTTEQPDNTDENSIEQSDSNTDNNNDEQPESAEQKEIERFMKGYTSVVNIKKSAEDFKNNKLFEDIENDEKDDKEEQ